MPGSGPPFRAEPPWSKGLAESVYETADRDPSLVQFSRRSATQPDGWEPMTAEQFRDEVLAVAKGFLANGIRFGDRVALMSRTRYEWTVLAYALWSVGAEVVPVYPTSSIEQVRWILYDAQVRAIVVEHENHAMTVAAATDAETRLSAIWQMDLGCVATLIDQGTGMDDDLIHRHHAAVLPDQVAAICYTSGTTGTPKGCLITHANLAAECDILLEGWGGIIAEPGVQPSILNFLPVAHIYGLMVVVACLRGGVRLGHQPDLTPEALLPALASFQPTFLFAVPYIFEKIFHKARRTAEEAGRVSLFDKAAAVAVRYAEAVERHSTGSGHGPGPSLKVLHAAYDRLVYSKLRAVLGGQVRNAVSGGSTLRRELGLFFAGTGITVYDGYGLTETAGGITAQPPGAVRFGTVGRPIPGCAVHIASDSEVWVRGDTVFAGYLNNPKATEAVLRDGWFATGDMGHLDGEGYLVITGRKKDVIITSGGKSVAPLPLEEQLRHHPLISQCLIVGDDQPYIAALITVDPEALAHWQALKGKQPLDITAMTDDEDLRAQIQRAVSRANTRVSRAESIRAFRILPQEFSLDSGLMTPTLKLKRRAITGAYAADIKALYTR
ncbi:MULTISPECIES: AMP-dependent synthetase/ligase [unclassified Streptomyces]|uniref:AMP-dependent synthetase/ligase n=1 Tax=unclassified Streptomyces TaxID=2593676 RepID=UPI002DD9E2E2|nr:AMP-dependent synthetase/ligase [Streptomyces sp. NBC_01750]WSA99026.1 AMP-dependent synthetase/ligase [Streptomyces sp. NBC_01794]WSD36406.1 AMP-dependent synthetase/ligase [Streptomyces sp. NBC_01750]